MPRETFTAASSGGIANIDDQHFRLTHHFANLLRIEPGHRGIGFGQHVIAWSSLE